MTSQTSSTVCPLHCDQWSWDNLFQLPGCELGQTQLTLMLSATSVNVVVLEEVSAAVCLSLGPVLQIKVFFLTVICCFSLIQAGARWPEPQLTAQEKKQQSEKRFMKMKMGLVFFLEVITLNALIYLKVCNLL